MHLVQSQTNPAKVAHMKKDPDLDPLRERDDFKQLGKDLEEDQEEVRAATSGERGAASTSTP